jgi:hypothetical protein
LETFSLTNQTVKKDWKLFHLQTKQSKKIGNFFTYKPNSQKRLETFSLTNQTVEKDWKLFQLETQHHKKFGNKRLETFQRVKQTVQKDWNLFRLLGKQFKKFGNFLHCWPWKSRWLLRKMLALHIYAISSTRQDDVNLERVAGTVM